MQRLRSWTLPALAILLAAGGQTEVWVAEAWKGPKPLAAFAALAPLGLMALRRYPLAAPVAIYGLYAAQSLAYGSPTSLTQFFTSAAVVFITVGFGTRRRALVVALTAVALAITLVRDPEAAGPDVVFPFVYVAVTVLVATIVRGRQTLADTERDRADRLEAEREALARAAVLDERVRIARELHDVVAHSVSVMVVQAVAAHKNLDRNRGAASQALTAIETTGQQALAEMRRLLGVLRNVEDTPLLVPQPGLDQLGSLVERAREAGADVALRTVGEPRPLPGGVDLSAYRIVQEALTNVIKHAGGARTVLEISYEPDRVQISVEDDGAARPSTSAEDGHGLIGMRERAALYGGDLVAGPRHQGGFAVRAVLPVTAA